MPTPWTAAEEAEMRKHNPRYEPRNLEADHARVREMLRHVDPKDDQDVWSTINAVMYTEPEKYRELQQYDRRDIECSMREGHSCPVFWHYSHSTETIEPRRSGRYIPREIMFKVARRDDYKCQICFKHVRDDEVEFDHIIPVAKGGPTTVANIRLLCRDCNRKKGDSTKEMIYPVGWMADPDWEDR
jgi:hypothetical protein